MQKDMRFPIACDYVLCQIPVFVFSFFIQCNGNCGKKSGHVN